jgi:hypothetical protein
MNFLIPLNPLPGGIFKNFVSPLVEGQCEGCGLRFSILKEGVKVPGVRGAFCSMVCLETGLFGYQCCRWCGCGMERAYTSLDSRLCTEDCRTNYLARVLGDYSAAVGTGQRFIRWIQSNRPAIYRNLIGNAQAKTGYCQNPACPNGSDGKPASLAHLRAGTLYCGESCKKRAQRSPNRQKQGAKTPVFIEVSRDTLREVGVGG